VARAAVGDAASPPKLAGQATFGGRGDEGVAMGYDLLMEYAITGAGDRWFVWRRRADRCVQLAHDLPSQQAAIALVRSFVAARCRAA
jgi:hypothetical protein